MIIEIDAGNTRLKWRRRERGGVVSAAAIADSVAAIAEALAGDAAQGVDAVRIASVRAPEALQGLIVECEAAFGCSATVAKVARHCAGLTIQYADPARLGVDRWLAMLAARARGAGAWLVVDCGTALTVDRIADDGCHEGGFIVPGLELMRASLEASTRIRLDSAYSSRELALGHSTDAAVYHGTLAAAVALIRQEWAGLHANSPQARLALTGGGASELLPQLPSEVELLPDLVLDGLAVAIDGPAA
ncbi:MAG: type III pantothenate kinase [Gammaproteobacteria bacterium]|jgi:type III pantothenate kinase|nr:type III pantothenate kinase [Gammaproteobacteria bacterium]